MNNHIHFDSFVDFVAKEAIFQEIDSFGSLAKLEKLYTTSKQHDDNISKTIKKKKRSENIKILNKRLSKIAVMMMICFTGIFAPFLTAEAVQESIVTTAIEWKDKFAVVFMESDIENGDERENYINNVEIGYIPDGFELYSSASENQNQFTKIYKNSTNYFVVNLYTNYNDYNRYIDNEHSEYYQIIINNDNGIWICRENINNLIISKNNFIYHLEGKISINELIRVFKNITIN